MVPDISGANDIHSHFIEDIACNTEQCRISDLDTPNNNLLTCFKQRLPSKLNTTTHTVEETTASNSNQQLHKQKTISMDNAQYYHIYKQKTICSDSVQYDHIRTKINDDSNLPILPLICKNIQTCTAFQNNIAISPNKN